MCVCVETGKEGGKECGCLRLSITMGVCMFCSCRDICYVRDFVWNMGSGQGWTYSAKEKTAVQLHIGSRDKWQGCQWNSPYSRSMAPVIEVLGERKLETKRSHRKAFSSSPHTAPRVLQLRTLSLTGTTQQRSALSILSIVNQQIYQQALEHIWLIIACVGPNVQSCKYSIILTHINNGPIVNTDRLLWLQFSNTISNKTSFFFCISFLCPSHFFHRSCWVLEILAIRKFFFSHISIWKETCVYSWVKDELTEIANIRAQPKKKFP